MTEQKRSPIEQLKEWKQVMKNENKDKLINVYPKVGLLILELDERLELIEERLGSFKHDGNVANNLEQLNDRVMALETNGKFGAIMDGAVKVATAPKEKAYGDFCEECFPTCKNCNEALIAHTPLSDCQTPQSRDDLETPTN
jgi:hypothetical protein